MTPERWQQVKAALAAALARAPGERDTFLGALRADDADLANEVESLLRHDAADFLEQPAMPTSMPASGSAFGPYLLQSTLGEGGMGVVYLAQDSTLERPVALKFLSFALEHQDDARRRFLREAKAAAALDHPYICKIYQTGERAGRPFIAMEYVRGDTLRGRLDTSSLSVLDAIGITLEVAEALETAHAAQIVHRDLKPSNIMLTPDGHVKVLDFGLAKRVGHEADYAGTGSALTGAGTVQGTVAYMSPEQVRGREVDLRSDLFSLGVVLYEMLAGRNPFVAGSALETASQILHHTPPPVSEQRSDVPAVLAQIVERLLAKARDDRYASAAELRRDLIRARDAGRGQESPADTRTGVPGQALASRLRAVSSRRAALGMLATAAVAAPAAAWWWMNRAAPATPPRSVAVMPFANVSGDPDNDYLATGIPRALTTRLQRAGFHVIPWETSSRFRDSTNPLDVARTLNVSAVLSGSFQSGRGHVVVNVSLVDGATGFLSWSDEFEQSDDLFEVQTQIARGVANALGHSLTADAAATLARPESSSKDAYDFYLQGAAYLNDGDRESTDLAFDYFSKAVTIDANLVDAHVGLGAVYLERYWSGWGGGAGNLALAARQFDGALGRDAMNMRARRGQMLIEFYRGRGEAALRLAQEAAKIGGDDIETLLARGEAYAINGPSDFALPLLERVRSLDPGNQAAAWLQTIALQRTGRFMESAAAAEDYNRRFGHDSFMAVIGASALERQGDFASARGRLDRVLEPLMGTVEPNTATAYDLAVLVGAGTFDELGERRERAQTYWQRGLQLTHEALTIASDSIGTRVLFCTFLGYTGDRGTFAREVASTEAILEAADLNPWELSYLAGAYAHLGDTDGALTVLRNQLRRGRCISRPWMTTFAPSLRSAPGLLELFREHDAEEERRRRRYRAS